MEGKQQEQRKLELMKWVKGGWGNCGEMEEKWAKLAEKFLKFLRIVK